MLDKNIDELGFIKRKTELLRKDNEIHKKENELLVRG